LRILPFPSLGFQFPSQRDFSLGTLKGKGLFKSQKALFKGSFPSFLSGGISFPRVLSISNFFPLSFPFSSLSLWGPISFREGIFNHFSRNFPPFLLFNPQISYNSLSGFKKKLSSGKFGGSFKFKASRKGGKNFPFFSRGVPLHFLSH